MQVPLQLTYFISDNCVYCLTLKPLMTNKGLSNFKIEVKTGQVQLNWTNSTE